MFMLVAVFGATACTQKFVRNGLPVAMMDEARPLGRDGLRILGDFNTPEEIEQLMIGRAASLRERFAAEFAAGNTPRRHFLALSGGGADGAVGAGILRAWTVDLLRSSGGLIARSRPAIPHDEPETAPADAGPDRRSRSHILTA
ncbi:MAG: hypothetical protein ACU0B1_11330 [Thermohalobaculum sp.]